MAHGNKSTFGSYNIAENQNCRAVIKMTQLGSGALLFMNMDLGLLVFMNVALALDLFFHGLGFCSFSQN